MASDTVIDLSTTAVTFLKKEQENSTPILLSGEQLYDSLPLPPGSRSIRLLELCASKANEPSLAGTLRVANLDASPSFASLSYVWGKEREAASSSASSASPRHTIMCQGGCTLQITANCYEALWHIRKRFRAVVIWVDSICINQEDEEEKVGQIPLMQDIYSLAEAVYIWLGPGDESSDRAIKFLRKRATLGRRMPLAVLAAVTKTAKRRESRVFRNRAWKDLSSTWGRN